MRKIEATISPFKLDDVRDGLIREGIDGMSVTEVRSFERNAPIRWYRGAKYAVDFVAQVKVEIVIADDSVERCLSVLRRCAAGDEGTAGYIVVQSVAETIQIRTGQRLARAA
jgi:nitrogen regulatory protein P-II 1